VRNILAQNLPKLVIISEDYLLIFLHVLLCNTYIMTSLLFDLVPPEQSALKLSTHAR
jgi:hypothetical protein